MQPTQYDGDQLRPIRQRELHTLYSLTHDQLSNLCYAACESVSLGRGKEAHVFGLPGVKTLVLRARGLMDSDHDYVCDPVRAVPIRYDAELAPLAGNSQLGLPRALIIPHDHPPVHPALPHKMPMHDAPVRYEILNRCSGQSLSQLYRNVHGEAYAALKRRRDIVSAQQAGLPTIFAAKRTTAAQRRAYMEQYHAILGSITELPQVAFNGVVASLAAIRKSPDYVRLSISHGGNTLIDFDRALMSFVDIDFTGRGQRGSLEHVALLLFGSQKTKIGYIQPWSLAMEHQAKQSTGAMMRMIIDKLDHAGRIHGIQWLGPTDDHRGFTALTHDFGIILARDGRADSVSA